MTTKPRTLEEIAERLAGDAYRLATLDGAWATEKILAALREAADAAIEHEKAYTCGCGLYVHHVRFNPKAVHSSDCPFGQAADAPRQEAREP